jgi:cell wall-associated NlpC family hydrolase
MKPGEWVLPVLNKPWKLGGRGPEEFDCFGLLLWVKRVYFGEDIPDFQSPGKVDIRAFVRLFEDGRGQGWEKVEKPLEGSAVALGKRNRIHHCGIFTTADRGLVVHASDGARVRAQNLRQLRVEGWGLIEFYSFKSPCP